jgi:hypothetical protein
MVTEFPAPDRSLPISFFLFLLPRLIYELLCASPGLICKPWLHLDVCASGSGLFNRSARLSARRDAHAAASTTSVDMALSRKPAFEIAPVVATACSTPLLMPEAHSPDFTSR